MTETESFESLRPLLFSIAYRMLARVSEAEDVVQEAYLRYQRALSEGARIESLKAYLSATVTRLVIDQGRSARARRESYVGQWLPEPLLTEGGDPADHSERAESLSMAFLIVLQRLNPLERAIFLLHDVFGYEHAEIAEMVGKREDHCRQLALRARKHIEADKPRFETAAETRDALAQRFFAAMTGGDVHGLAQMLARDAVVYGDGGGKAPQWSKPVVGAENIARLLSGVGTHMGELGLRLSLREINGQPGAMIFDPRGQLINVFALDILDGAVHAVRSVINPDKLRHLGPVADVRALLLESPRARRSRGDA